MITEGDGVAREIAAVARKIAERSGTSDKAMQTFTACLELILSSAWPDVVWRFSGLNTDGSPVEFAFSSADDKLRYTTEVAGPELDTHERLGAAYDLILRLHHPPPPAERVEFWRSIQAGCPLRWGAWLGIRHDGLAERAKLYVEVPGEARNGETAIVRPLVPGSQLVMIGYDPELKAEEHYFRQPQVDEIELDVFLRFFSGSDSGRPLLTAFGELCRMPPRAALRWTNFGYSLARQSPTDEPQLSIFVRSRSFGAITMIRDHMLKCERKRGKCGSAYGDLLGKVEEHQLPDHGTVSLISKQDGEIEMRVGLSGMALAGLCHRLESAS
jgi:hypothetical protein